MVFASSRSPIWAMIFSGVFLSGGYLWGDDPASKKPSDSDRPAGAANNDDDALHHGTLGVSLGETATGVRVIAVMPGSPAAHVGLHVGDEIRTVRRALGCVHPTN